MNEASTIPDRPTGWRDRGWLILRWAVGLLLITAAVLKGYELATRPTAEENLLTYRWSLTIQVHLELLLGLWLLAGLLRRLTWAATLLCFVGFSGVTLYRGLAGEASCGCFGPVVIPPYHTLALDLTIVAALLIFRPTAAKPMDHRRAWRRLATVAGAYLLAAVPLQIAMASYRPATLEANGQIAGAGGFVVLTPDAWVDRRFPLLEHVDIGPQLATGRWLVVPVHDTCRECRASAGRYRQLAEQAKTDSAAPQVALIEMSSTPPAADSPLATVPCLHGRVSDQHEWFCRTPRELTLHDGIVVSVNGQTEPVTDGTEITGEETLIHRFGIARLGATVGHTFVLTNRGDRPWRVREILVDCACTQPPSRPEPIKPGQTWAVPVKVVTDTVSDTFTAAVVVTFHQRPPIRLQVTGRVVVQAPALVDFGEVTADDSPVRTFHLRSLTDRPITVRTVRYDKRLLTVIHSRSKTEPNDVRFELRLRAAAAGPIQTSIDIETNNPNNPTITVRVSGRQVTRGKKTLRE